MQPLEILMKLKTEWPKFGRLTFDLAEINVVGKRNVLLLCEQPATTLWLYHALSLLHFNVSFYYSSLSNTAGDLDVTRILIKTHRRRRPEWPVLDESVVRAIRENQVFASKDIEIQNSVKNLVMASYKQCAAEDFHTAEDNVPIHTALRYMHEAEPDWYLLFKNPVYRVRQQSAIWDMFMHLTERDLIDKACLTEPLNYDLGHVDVSTVSAILLSLEVLDKGFENDSEFPGYYSFILPHWWLATMIVRGGCNAPNNLFSIIEWTGMFGDFNARKFPRLPHYTSDPLACSRGNRNGFRFGEWLPQGLGEDRSVWSDAIHKCLTRFWEVERVWKE